MPRLLPFVLTVLLVPGVAAQAPGDTLVLDLEGAIMQALEVSPEVDQIRAQRQFAEGRHAEARASRFLTEFTATTAHAPAPGIDVPGGLPANTDSLYLVPSVRNDWEDVGMFNQIEVEALQPLWTWGELSGSIRAARHGVDVEAAEVQGKALEVAFRTGELYYNLLLTDELSRIADEASDIVDRAEGEVQRLVEEEGADYADLFQVQITAQEVRRRVVEVEQNRLTARMAMARQLFLPEGAVVTSEARRLEPIAFEREALDVYLERALPARPEIEQATAGLAAREALVDVARSNYYPKLFLSVSARYAYAPNRYRQRNPYIGEPFLSRSVRAGVGMRQRLNFFQTGARVEQAEAERNEVRYQLQQARQLVLFEVEEAYRRLVTAEAALEAADQSLQISKEWLRTEQVNFDLDIGETENLVDAVRANLELQASYYEAVRNYNVAVLRLLRRTGTLTRRAESGMLVAH